VLMTHPVCNYNRVKSKLKQTNCFLPENIGLKEVEDIAPPLGILVDDGVCDDIQVQLKQTII
jgi:hypothetical protein